MLEVAAGRRMSDEALVDAREVYDLDRTLAVFEDGRIVGGTSSDLLELTVPGPATMPAARIMNTGVLATHRRRGFVTALWTQQVLDLYERGEPLAVFTTTGPGIYGRYGYAPASTAAEIELDTVEGAASLAASPSGLRALDEKEFPAILPPVFDLHRAMQPGQVSRPERFWRVWLRDRERYRRDALSERFVVVFEDAAGRPTGYVTYRLGYGDARDEPVHKLDVEELVATTDEARQALWSYCLGFRQASVLHAANVAVDEPVRWMLADPRSLRVLRLREFLWLRLVDLPAAFSRRGYAATDNLVFEVADSLISDNTGRFRLEATYETASWERTEKTADILLGIAELAAAYLGGFTLTALKRAGRIIELTPGAVARADALFASWPAPWTVTDW